MRKRSRTTISGHVTTQDPERTYVVHVVLKRGVPNPRSSKICLEEAVGLAEAISLDVVAESICTLMTPRPATLLGKGWVEQLKREVLAHHIGLLYINATLSPVQQRNLEKILTCKVIDRTALILEIFGRRAQTAEGRLQVELASLQYQKSRLVRSWTHLERQKGGFGFMGGPGESQLELDRRMLNERILKIKSELVHVKQTRKIQRNARQKVPFLTLALVGYTNAGKSTLFNQLTQEKVLAADFLFATLDPTLRQIRLPHGRQVILSDTVGFISNLPTDLVLAFRSTLEEVMEADLILHVRDISHPETEIQKSDVEKVLRDLGLQNKIDTALFEVWNKIDTLTPERRAFFDQKAKEATRPTFLLSAKTGEGDGALLQGVENFCARQSQTYHIRLDPADGKNLSWLYEHGTVLSRKDEEEQIQLDVVLSAPDSDRFVHMVVASLHDHLMDEGSDDSPLQKK